MRPRTPIALRRMSLGYTQLEFAEKTGISKSTIELLDQGRGDPKTSSLIVLVEALDCSYNELIDDIEESWKIYNGRKPKEK